MALRIFQVDAFTDKLFSGNPAAICILDGPREPQWMQNVAFEMNLSETAFLLKKEGGFDLRWFTPLVEVDLCGHATLASAHVLWETGEQSSDTPIHFFSKSGTLIAEKKAKWIELDFPAVPEHEVSCPEGLVAALKTTPVYVGRKGKTDYIVEVDSEDTLRSLRPDMALLRTIARGIVVTSRSQSKDFDFVSRFFAPQEGIDEDPVTGSAHCCLGPYWKKQLGKAELTAFQASKRGGVVKVVVGQKRVRLGGQAVMVSQGTLFC